METVVKHELPSVMRFEWTELALLQLQTGITAMLVFVLAVVLVFLVLAAQYESWTLPMAVILVVPMCLLCSVAGVAFAKTVGIISSYFTGQDRTRALGLYAASGAVGFTAGLVLGGLLSSSLGWQYIFRLSVIVSTLLAVLGFIALPSTPIKKDSESRMDFLGASLSTAGLILLAFVLSGGGIYGWGKAFIIVLLILSVALLVTFVLYEKKISNPIMPLSLWKIRNFASLWVCGFGMFYPSPSYSYDFYHVGVVFAYF